MVEASRLILGVDPGSRITGWGLIRGHAQSPQLHDSGTVRLPPGQSFEQRLAKLHAEIHELTARHRPAVAAVEAPFHGVSARSALQLAHARGVILAAIASNGVPVIEYAPATIKKTVTGHGRADKDQVAAEVVRVFGPVTASSDLTDAIAVALCHQIRGRFDQIVEAALRKQSSVSR
ncbi:MAG: crossover junction endodeoxyribonuclease RuvC [Acidobacteriota bacterium]|nr:crossover junction endodeoxyribonuclease RuvC [Acidobacteriota bacterium]MDH3785252.1 crossover junction endodeoxyribonuclease RuvC [Acidobacteriota bacterium]